MKNLILSLSLTFLFFGCGQESSKFPINYSCMGGVGVSITKDKVTIGTQIFKYQIQDGNLRKYKDDIENTVFSYDVASESMSLIKYDGNQIERILQIPDCTKKK